MLKYRCQSTTFVALVLSVLLMQNAFVSEVDAGRTYSGSNRKSSSGGSQYSNRRTSTSSNSHVTRPSYNTNNHGSNSDLTKLSYPSHNSQPNNHAMGTGAAGGGQSAPIGWNVPKNQGPPPAYSPSNTVGGAHTNMHESPPAYRPNNAAPPSYAASNVHQPISATNAHSVQSGYPQQHMPAGGSYYPAGQVPAGATYYPSGHVPAGGSYYPGGHMPGASYYPAGGHMPAGATYYPSGGIPQGATYIPAGGALPQGATYYASPPQQSSSGLGFGSGLAAGAIGGALLGHALTPTQTRVVEHAPSSGGSSGDDKIIIINNGEPGNVQKLADGTTVITTGGQQSQPPAAAGQPAPAAPVPNQPLPQQPGQAAAMPPADPNNNAMGPVAAAAPLAPLAGAPMTNENATNGEPQQSPPPPPGGIICVPTRVNETDPNDATKTIEVEKVACYPAPPPPQPAPEQAMGMNPATPVASTDNNANPNAVPLAPMNSAPGQNAPQIQAVSNENVPVARSSANALFTKQVAATTTITSLPIISMLLCLLLRNGMH